MNARAAVALVALLGACVPTPEDPLDFGSVCTPGTDECAASVLLQRDVSGRNQIDYVITNLGDGIAVPEVLAVVPSADLTDGELDEVDPADLVARREHEPLPPGGTAENRFTAQDLGVRDSFLFVMRCSGCELRMDWVYASVPRDCFEADDCPAGWQCDENLGRCAECVANSDCNSDQRCNAQTGRCDPPDTTAGCATAQPSNLVGPWFVMALVVAGRLRRRRRALAGLVGGLAALVASPVHASPPRASISVSAGARELAGPLGPVTKRGIGLSVGQELRWRHIGAATSLGTSYFLTTHEPPPFSRSFQTYGVTLGPRAYLPIRAFELVAGLDYRRLGLANNSLIRMTGARTSFDAVGGQVGARARWSGLELRLEGGAHYIPGLETTVFGLDLGVGFTNAR